MTIKETYFFDTYAILEIINGTKSYEPYINSGVILTKLNLFELFCSLLKLHTKEKAIYYLQQYSQFVVDFDEHDIEAAAEVKLKNKSLSMTDCIGYIVALKNNVKFLTGDKGFKDVPNVEFAK